MKGGESNMYIFMIAMIVITMAISFQVYEKAGSEGWKAWIPFLNVWEWFKIAGMNPLLMLLLIIPGVNVIIHLMVGINVSKRFNLGTLGTVLYILFTPLMMIYLATSSSVQYTRA